MNNSFGNIFRITTFGESHGPAVGVVIDGVPSNIEITETDINIELQKRAPGKSPYVSPRQETDKAIILSGIFENKTTGAPIAILINNHDANSAKYDAIKDIIRPGHANGPYLAKYKIFDYRGGGRASARETAARVAAGAIAKKILAQHKIKVCAYVHAIGPIAATINNIDYPFLTNFTKKIIGNPLYCPDEKATQKMICYIEKIKKEKDSTGGTVGFIVSNLPAGLGDPIYKKLNAELAYGLMSIPAAKGVEFDMGFAATTMKGSEHNKIPAGILAGISSGQPITGKIAFKPTPSIAKAQETIDVHGNKTTLQLPDGSRHDPCVAVRAVPVVEAMINIVLADAILANRL